MTLYKQLVVYAYGGVIRYVGGGLLAAIDSTPHSVSLGYGLYYIYYTKPPKMGDHQRNTPGGPPYSMTEIY